MHPRIAGTSLSAENFAKSTAATTGRSVLIKTVALSHVRNVLPAPKNPSNRLAKKTASPRSRSLLEAIGPARGQNPIKTVALVHVRETSRPQKSIKTFCDHRDDGNRHLLHGGPSSTRGHCPDTLPYEEAVIDNSR